MQQWPLDTAKRRDAGENVNTLASCCKLFATEMVGNVLTEVQIYGGAGYIEEYVVARFYRDVRLFRLYEGTSQVQQGIIAKNLLKNIRKYFRKLSNYLFLLILLRSSSAA